MGGDVFNTIFCGISGTDTRTPAVDRSLQIAGIDFNPENRRSALQQGVQSGQICIYENKARQWPDKDLVEYEIMNNGQPIIKEGLLNKLCITAARYNDEGRGECGRKQFVMLVIYECGDYPIEELKTLLGASFQLLEKDKRIHEKDCCQILLPFSQRYFRMPANVHLICSLSPTLVLPKFDNSFFRRFRIVAVTPDYKKLDKVVDGVCLAALVSDINHRLNEDGIQYVFGHQQFAKVASLADAAGIIKKQLSRMGKEHGDLRYIYAGWPI